MRLIKALILTLACCSISTSMYAQVYSVNFDQFAENTPAESLNIPGTTFTASPAGSWVVVDTSFLGFASLSGMALYEPSQVGSLDITFSTSVASVAFSFAQNDAPGNSTLKAEAFSGTSLVGSVTQGTTSAGEYFGEGFVNLVPGSAFNRVRISSPSGHLIAIDNLRASGASIAVVSQPSGMLQVAGSAGGTDSYSIANRGSITSNITLGQSGSFFTQSPTSFALAPGATRTITITGLVQGPGSFNGTSTISGSGTTAGLSVPITLLSAIQPTGTVVPVPSLNRVDVSSSGSTGTGQVSFTNNGNSTLQGVLVSDVPWIIPQSGTITIPPGRSVTVNFTINRGLRPDSSFPIGSLTGSLRLVFISGVSAKGEEITPFGAPTGVSLVTVVDTAKPGTSSNGVPPLNPGELALYVPGIGHVAGSVGTFISDVTLGNSVDLYSLGNVMLRYTPTTASAANATLTTVPTLLPNQSVNLADIVKNVYGADSQVGSLQIRSASIGNLAVSANIFNSSNPAGTYGTAIPTFRSDRAAATGKKLYLAGLLRTATYHTNLYIQETQGVQANVHTDFLAANGSVLGSRDDSVDPFKLLQITNPVPDGGVAAIVTNTGGGGNILAYATPVDEASGDTWAVADWNAQYGSDPTQPVVIPVAGAVAGANNTFFRTDFSAINNGVSNVTLSMKYYPQSGGVVSKTTTLTPKQSFSGPDVVRNFFGITTATVGFITVTPLGGSAAITSRTYNTVAGSTKTYGTAVPSLPLGRSLRLGQKKVISGIEDSTVATVSRLTPATFRTNVGLVETAGAAATVRVSLLFADGRSLAGTVVSKDYPLTPNQFLQIPGIANNILDANRSTYGDLRNLTLKFEVISGSGAVTVYTSSTDNGTGDSILRTE